ncbi:MAG: hypothetical protein IKC36_00835 [Clostridia bacterium]|nr:hypothetical protein [Clostridia bacterium]
MKKRYLAIFPLIMIIVSAIFGTATVSAAEIPWEEVGSISFDSLKVGASSTKDGATINTGNALFSKIGLKGKGTVRVVKEGGDTFVRATTTDSSQFVALSCLPGKALPVTTYRITITYRLSNNISFTDATRGFVARIWNGEAAHTHDRQIVTKTAELSGYTEWRTESVEIKTRVESNAVWFFVYAKGGGYFDVKDIKLEAIGSPELAKTVNYDASKNEDLVIDCNLKGNVIDYVDDWSNEANVRELKEESYFVAEDGRSITVKREFMQTLKPGEKSLVFNINGREHVVVVKVYNSTVADAPVKAAAVKPATDPATEPAQNHGTVIAIAAGAAVVVVAVVVTAVEVKKRKKA